MRRLSHRKPFTSEALPLQYEYVMMTQAWAQGAKQIKNTVLRRE